ncbi:cryptochrome/photolyase family protein [Marinoscillum furvescens]|uniref:Deoxyribodipyrimidine photolyase-related protein n=1 Tax=Marinoscillum furvescens DSM 4134 TaxID=1122208 RepID=A0A3D9L3F1_MARFU|nr:cryptochrome/photolyase family protein [Marinoscillum furvescens]RED98932.1 deoxyribodipyrimidine photolyase-related protein [Marinoscillum furvescens DSM 4134]
MHTLRLLLGDQLNAQHSWFDQTNDDTYYVMMEMRQETDYVRHHVQKVVGFFAAMRAFAKELEKQGHRVIYLKLNAKNNLQDLTKNLSQLIKEHNIERFEYLLPDEYRLDEQLNEYCQTLDIPWKAYDTEHFYTTRDELTDFFKGKKTYLMESFYRHMRKKHDVLMDGKEPVTGQWNYDKENRKTFPKQFKLPDRSSRTHDLSSLVQMLEAEGVETMGKIDAENYRWPITRREALADLQIFCERFLTQFGDYQDAMHTEVVFGYHSLISFALNIKLISPKEVIDRVIDTWQEGKEAVPFAAVEGFVRQIIGWREFMRGIYWAKMPDYAKLNYFGHSRKLPQWYWTGDTKMSCLRHAIKQSLDYAYAHHIQRLMITGNFALLTQVDPTAVDAWYLGIYIDAIEWVEITNTRGMSQFADGGIVGSKPYVSSANYIHKMSNYCSSCHYKATQKTGDKACPFNSLYWNFYDQHRKKLEKNPRIGMMYRTWDRMDAKTKTALLQQADKYLQEIDEL